MLSARASPGSKSPPTSNPIPGGSGVTLPCGGCASGAPRRSPRHDGRRRDHSSVNARQARPNAFLHRACSPGRRLAPSRKDNRGSPLESGASSRRIQDEPSLSRPDAASFLRRHCLPIGCRAIDRHRSVRTSREPTARGVAGLAVRLDLHQRRFAQRPAGRRWKRGTVKCVERLLDRGHCSGPMVSSDRNSAASATPRRRGHRSPLVSSHCCSP